MAEEWRKIAKIIFPINIGAGCAWRSFAFRNISQVFEEEKWKFSCFALCPIFLLLLLPSVALSITFNLFHIRVYYLALNYIVLYARGWRRIRRGFSRFVSKTHSREGCAKASLVIRINNPIDQWKSSSIDFNGFIIGAKNKPIDNLPGLSFLRT